MPVLLLPAILISSTSIDTRTTLPFDEVVAGDYVHGGKIEGAARIGDRFVSRNGVRISSTTSYAAIVDLDRAGRRHATSRRNGIIGVSPDGQVSYSATDPIIFTFLDPKSRKPASTDFFSIRQDLLGEDNGKPVTLRAFNSAGDLLVDRKFADVSGSEMTLNEPGMHRVEFINNGSTALDDLTFGRLRMSGQSTNHALRFRNGEVVTVPYRKAMDVQEGTFEAWIRIDPSASDLFYNYILCRNYSNLGYGLALHGNHPKVFSQAPGTPVEFNRWTHVAAVVSTKAFKMYVNGELTYTEPRQGPLSPFTHDLMIGNSDFFGEPGHTSTAFRGWIDEVRIWSRPRTQQQVKSTMNRFLSGRERGLIGYYDFEEGNGIAVRDRAGKLGPGTLSLRSGNPWSEGPPLDRR